MTDTSNVIISGLTNAGARILSSAQMGEDIIFTKMKIGDGNITTQDTANLTDLINPIENLDIENYEIISNDDNSVVLKFTSFVKQAESSYYFRELGLFAIDPETNQEILYAYVNKGDNPTYIPQNSTNVAVKELASIIVAVSNKLNIIVNSDNNRISVLSREIGELVYSALPITSANLHLTDGSVLQGGGIYQQFVNHIKNLYTSNSSANYFCTENEWQTSVTTYGVCAKFVYNSINNTVRLPKITGIIEGTIDISALGTLVAAGLPNITGAIDGRYTPTTQEAFGEMFPSTSGAFEILSGEQYTTEEGAYLGEMMRGFTFDASKSNPIYGNSNTVQPQTVKGFVYIVVSTSAKPDIQVDIDNIATDLNGKADTSLLNISTSGKEVIGTLSMPSNNVTVIASSETGIALPNTVTTYTAISNGYINLYVQFTGGYISLRTNSIDTILNVSSFGNSSVIPIKKGQTFIIDITQATGINYWIFKFIEIEGNL